MKTNQDSFENQIRVVITAELLETWAEFFTIQHSPDLAMHGADLLNVAQLDYSIDSLRQVDVFLGKVRMSSVPRGSATFRLVNRCGAYVGEVIRRSESPRSLVWTAFECLPPATANTVVPTKSIENFVALRSASKAFTTFPYAEVCRAVFFEECRWFYFRRGAPPEFVFLERPTSPHSLVFVRVFGIGVFPAKQEIIF